MFTYKVVISEWVVTQKRSGENQPEIAHIKWTSLEWEKLSGNMVTKVDQIREVENFLNRMSREGWEIVTVNGAGTDIYRGYIFRKDEG
jgi:hypothetical protein